MPPKIIHVQAQKLSHFFLLCCFNFSCGSKTITYGESLVAYRTKLSAKTKQVATDEYPTM